MLDPGRIPEHFKAKLNTQMVEMVGSWVYIINVWSPEIVEEKMSKTVSLEVGPIGCEVTGLCWLVNPGTVCKAWWRPLLVMTVGSQGGQAVPVGGDGHAQMGGGDTGAGAVLGP